jgi:quinol monooxygenase YgiN
MNVAVWESTEALATAVGSPEFQRMAAEFPDDIASYPHIFEQIDV